MKLFTDPHGGPALKFLLAHLAAGLLGALLTGGLLLWLDFGGLATLIRGSEHPWLAIALLFFGLFVTFGSCAAAVGVMAVKGRDNGR